MNRDPRALLEAMQHAIWTGQPDSMPRWRGLLVRVARLSAVLSRDLVYGQLNLWAMSLVYTTLLSIVPLLAFSFSVLKAFGVHNQIEPMLRQFLAPLGSEGDELSQRLIQFIDHMNVGVLGSVGLALLLYTVVSLVQKIEESFNFIWHVSQPRSLANRFTLYLSVLLVGPIFVFAAIGLTAAAMNIELVRQLLALQPLGWMVYATGKLTPYVLAVAAFTFIYLLVPNTNVRLGPALIGGIAGGVLWQLGGWGFARFVASSTRYPAIYSGFAVVILFMFWLYLSWLILLFGASVAFYRQHPEYLIARGGEPALSSRMRERLALAIMSLIGRHYRTGDPAWKLRQLTRVLRVPMHSVQVVLDALEQGGLLARNSEDPPGYLPVCDLNSVPVKRLLDTVRAAGEEGFLNPGALPVPSPVERVIQRLQEAMDAAVDDVNVMELAGDPHAGTGAPSPSRSHPAEASDQR
ncbi:MAG TPA: YihY/virulence factor BrkB family protein [Burkholderiales bacterium]|nr:YihY/virulence factor BrkB family protein [Burkholderiales bacterium]